MSNKLQGRVWDMEGLGEDLKIVLVRMADHANSGGHCFPGQDSLARDCDVAGRTIRRRIDILDRLGLVEKKRRHRRATQEYQLHLTDNVWAVNWGSYVDLVRADPVLHLGHGWFDQDRPQVAGQTVIAIEDLETGQDRKPLTALPGGLDRTQDRTPETLRPDTGDSKTGQGWPVPKDTSSEPSANRARRTEFTESELRELALEWAKAKGARNPAGLATRILFDDRADLIAELARRLEGETEIWARMQCAECDERGFRWVDDGATAVICTHPDVRAVSQ